MPRFPDGTPVAGVAAFALPSLGWSALLPLTIGFGEEQLESIAAAAAGGIIAFYQVGYGIAASTGPLPFTVVGRCHQARSEPSPTARAFT